MRLSSILVCGFLSAIVTSCASVNGYPKRSESVNVILAQLNASYPIKCEATAAVKCVFEEYDSKTSNADKKAYRNQVIAARMMAIDIRFSEFQKKMFGQRSSLKVSGDIAKTVMGAAGALTTAGQTSQILSGLSAGFDAGNNSVTANVYNGDSQVAVMSMMLAERTQARTNILKKSELEASAYPLARALSDLEDYYAAGSVPNALAAITASVGEKQAEAKSELNRVIEAKYISAEGQAAAKTNLTEIDKLKSGEAKKILLTPPSTLTDYVKTVAGISGGLPVISGFTDDQARQSLKRIVVLFKDRESDDYKAWTASLEAADKK